MNRTFHFAPGIFRAAARRGVVAAAQLHDLAGRVLHHTLALHDVAVAQPHFAARLQAVELAGRILHEVLALDVYLARYRHFAAPKLRFVRVIRGVERLLFVFRVRVDHDLQRIEHGEAPRRALVQVFADAGLELAELRDLALLRHAHALHERAD